ncbi:hypothetical protein LZ32DRAFT_460644 [Colletotrichum eremochloae]|nr:hypothetical protein LZ32DRAFT_460644 [Colletotrichum eremochloae]
MPTSFPLWILARAFCMCGPLSLFKQLAPGGSGSSSSSNTHCVSSSVLVLGLRIGPHIRSGRRTLLQRCTKPQHPPLPWATSIRWTRSQRRWTEIRISMASPRVAQGRYSTMPPPTPRRTPQSTRVTKKRKVYGIFFFLILSFSLHRLWRLARDRGVRWTSTTGGGCNVLRVPRTPILIVCLWG